MAAAAADEPSRPAQQDGKVLIVDDEPEVLESTALLAESLGYIVLRLDDPADILDVIERERPGVVLQDLRMPGLNVAGLIASLRSNPATAEVPLIFFSAGHDLATTSARYDVWGYLSKPFGRSELAAILERAMGPPRAQDLPRSRRQMQREMRDAFHDYWNLLSALSNYVQVLRQSDHPDPDDAAAIKGLEEALLKLESKTDRLRAFLSSVLGAIEPIAEAKKSGPRTGAA